MRDVTGDLQQKKLGKFVEMSGSNLWCVLARAKHRECVMTCSHREVGLCTLNMHFSAAKQRS